jgi:S4 domain
MRDVPIRDDVIRLGQFLKLACVIESGGEAKSAIAVGEVASTARRNCAVVGSCTAVTSLISAANASGWPERTTTSSRPSAHSHSARSDAGLRSVR